MSNVGSDLCSAFCRLIPSMLRSYSNFLCKIEEQIDVCIMDHDDCDSFTIQQSSGRMMWIHCVTFANQWSKQASVVFELLENADASWKSYVITNVTVVVLYHSTIQQYNYTQIHSVCHAQLMYLHIHQQRHLQIETYNHKNSPWTSALTWYFWLVPGHLHVQMHNAMTHKLSICTHLSFDVWYTILWCTNYLYPLADVCAYGFILFFISDH